MTKYGRSSAIVRSTLHPLAEARPIENIVAQGQSAGKGTVTAGRRPTGIQQGAADPTDNSFIVRGSAESIREINRLIEKGEVSPKVKVDKTLLDAKTTKVEVQVYVTDVSDEVVKALKKAGLVVDDKDKTLKLVFGTIEKSKLEALAKLKTVVFIGPIDG